MPENVLEKPIVREQLEALRFAFLDAVREHARAGVPVVIWKDGKVHAVPAEDLLQEIDEHSSPVPEAQ